MGSLPGLGFGGLRALGCGFSRAVKDWKIGSSWGGAGLEFKIQGFTLLFLLWALIGIWGSQLRASGSYEGAFLWCCLKAFLIRVRSGL